MIMLRALFCARGVARAHRRRVMMTRGACCRMTRGGIILNDIDVNLFGACLNKRVVRVCVTMTCVMM